MFSDKEIGLPRCARQPKVPYTLFSDEENDPRVPEGVQALKALKSLKALKAPSGFPPLGTPS